MLHAGIGRYEVVPVHRPHSRLPEGGAGIAADIKIHTAGRDGIGRYHRRKTDGQAAFGGPLGTGLARNRQKHGHKKARADSLSVK